MPCSQLDRDTATKIMGWDNGPNANYWWDKGKATKYQQTGGYHHDEEMWRPSIDIDHAMTVVERMRQRGFSFGLWQVPDVSSVMTGTMVAFRASIYPPERNDVIQDTTYWANDRKAATAICLAALKTIDATSRS